MGRFTLIYFKYTGDSLSTDVRLCGRINRAKFKLDTGSPITIITAATMEYLTGYNIKVIQRFLSSKKSVVFHSFTQESVSVVPCLFRGAVIGEANHEGRHVNLDYFMVFVANVLKGNNLLGMDFMAGCEGTFEFGKFIVNDFEEHVYHRHFLRQCGNIDPYEIDELKSMASKSSVNDLLSRAEGN